MVPLKLLNYKFAQNHVHTEYSPWDAPISLKKLVKRSKELGYRTVAVTDHGTVGSWVKLAGFCKAEGVRPIFGVEAYFAPDRKDRSKRVNYHLILLAKDKEGLGNIFRLVDASYKEGFYYSPRVDWELLEKYHGGVICSTACVHGIVPRAFFPEDNAPAKGYEEARRLALRFKGIFGKDFYCEVQYHGFDLTDKGKTFSIPEESVYLEVAKLAKEIDVPVVATNDVHYLEKADAPTQEAMMALNLGKCLKDPDRIRHESNQYYLKSPDEMFEVFGKNSAPVAGALEIADKCDAVLEMGKSQLPSIEIPKEYRDDMEYLESLARRGLRERGKEGVPEYEERFKEEMRVIRALREKGKQFDRYFLIVWDYVNYAKSVGVMVGAGRGSGCGSLLLWCLGITGLDPLPYDLLFERFLTEDRNDMPDIDVDFDSEDGHKVYEYVCKKYGVDRCSRIGTLGVYHVKSAIRAAFRVFDPGNMWEQAEDVRKQAKQSREASKHVGSVRQERQIRDKTREMADEISDLLPKGPKPCTLLKEVAKEDEDVTYLYEAVPQLLGYKEKYPEEFAFAEKIEGLLDGRSTHAAGVLITKDELVNLSPLERSGERANAGLATTFDMGDIEKLGGVKFDFLFTKVLAILKRAVKTIGTRYGKPLDIDNVPMDDPVTLAMFAKGDTVAIFQFESDGMRRLLRSMKLSCFEDVIAANALYRPGPMQYIEEYVGRKTGSRKVAYSVPVLEPVLKPTLGIMIYQEQVMKATRVLAGFSALESERVRKAMGKKKKDILEAMRGKFVQGCQDQKTTSGELAAQTFKELEKFSEYAFNKSHSAGYSKTAYQCAWLKAHYPAEFMAAQLTVEAADGKYDTVKKYENALSYMRIPLLSPCINSSKDEYVVSDTATGKTAVRRGLKGLKGVGPEACRDIIAGQPYADMFDFCMRGGVGNKKDVVETMVEEGAMDVFKPAVSACLGREATKHDMLLDYQDKSKRSIVEKKNRKETAGMKSTWDDEGGIA